MLRNMQGVGKHDKSTGLSMPKLAVSTEKYTKRVPSVSTELRNKAESRSTQLSQRNSLLLSLEMIFLI